MRRRVMTERVKKLVRFFAERGVSPLLLARHLGLPEDAVRRWAWYHGIKPRRRLPKKMQEEILRLHLDSF